MKLAIQDIEALYREKTGLFQELLTLVRQEKETIIQADIKSLWVFTRQKQDLADKIHEIRRQIMIRAVEAGILDQEDIDTYSMATIIAALSDFDKKNLVHLRFDLNAVKGTITALARENRKYLEESMKTVEDLVQIIVKNCDRDERYGRDRYMQYATSPRSGLIRGEV